MISEQLRRDAELRIRNRGASNKWKWRLAPTRHCAKFGGARLLLALGHGGSLRQGITNGGAAFFVGAAQ